MKSSFGIGAHYRASACARKVSVYSAEWNVIHHTWEHLFCCWYNYNLSSLLLTLLGPIVSFFFLFYYLLVPKKAESDFMRLFYIPLVFSSTVACIMFYCNYLCTGVCPSEYNATRSRYFFLQNKWVGFYQMYAQKHTHIWFNALSSLQGSGEENWMK